MPGRRTHKLTRSDAAYEKGLLLVTLRFWVETADRCQESGDQYRIPCRRLKKGVMAMGIFGGYTRWAVVFLIIFVLFILFTPDVYGTGAGAGAAVGY